MAGRLFYNFNKVMLPKIQDKVEKGRRLSPEEALCLFNSDDIFLLGEMASEICARKNEDRVYYSRNVHINPSNICVNRCRFCAFSRSKGEEGAFEYSIGEIIEKLESAPPFDEVHVVGGLHPEWPFSHYLEIVRSIKNRFPRACIKAFTATEVDYMRRISGFSLERVFGELKAAGLDLMPGGGAEIFDASVRGRLCPEKLSGEGWLDVMRRAHKSGIRTNATMLYGHVENASHRVDHLARLRALQDETGGFLAFIPLLYQPWTSSGGRSLPASRMPSAIDALRCIAVSRIFLDNFDHIKAYWIMLGEKLSQISLFFGSDDLEGTVIEEKIAHMAGARTKNAMPEAELRRMIEKAGKKPVRRDSFYNEIKQKRSA